MRNPFTGHRYTKGYFHRQRVRDLLLLVDAPEDIDTSSWTPEQLLQAGDWALRSHLRASDNLNRVPPKPAFIPDRPWNSGARTVMEL